MESLVAEIYLINGMIEKEREAHHPRICCQCQVRHNQKPRESKSFPKSPTDPQLSVMEVPL